MKIHAIRLAEVGRFSTPVALEGLSGQLDVLAGPNELGKSTLLRAMRCALTEKYSSTQKDVRQLQPYAGGAPLVEIDFTIDGKDWRLQKRFLAGKSALLSDLGNGQVSRNSDAEALLDRLLTGPSDRARLGLLWVEQGDGIEVAAPDGAAQTTLRTLIASEVETIADGGAARRILSEVAKALQRLVTPNNRRPTADYLAAIKARELSATAAQRASERYAAARERLDRLAVTTERLDGIASGPATAARAEALLRAETRRDEAERARQAHDRARLDEERARARLDRAAQAFAAFDRQIQDLATAEALVAKLSPQADVEAATLAERTRQLDAAETHVRALLARADAAGTALREAEVQDRHGERARHHAGLARQLDEARGHAARSQQLTATLAAAGVTLERVREVRAIEAELAALAARRAARAPTIAIALATGAAGRIRVASRAVTASETIAAEAAVVLTIAGVGEITVTPAAVADADDDRRRDSERRQQSDRCLAAMGAPTLAVAEALLMERETVEAERRDVAATLKALAPQGLAVLEQDCARVAAALGTLLPSAQPAQSEVTVAAARTAFTQATAQMKSAEASVLPQRQEVRDGRERWIAQSTELKSARERVAALQPTLRDAAWRQDQLQALRADRAAAEAEHAAAVRELSSWRQALPDAAMLQAILQQVATVGAENRQRDGEAQRLKGELHMLEGQLSRDREDDSQAEAEAADQAHTRAAAKVGAIENELAALLLIERELSAAEAAGVDRLLAPVLTRIMPYLARVFPDARLGLDETFLPTGLVRGGTDESLSRLSHGTREQIAVIARLGFARLLADRHAGVPLILDDALVYADDSRIAAMFESLQQASHAHQVIVLTCRERSFEMLGGNRLELKPWANAPVR